MQVVPRVTNVKLDASPPRANVMVMGRGKPLEQRPVINYTPVDVSVDFYKADNTIETMLGLVHPSSPVANITETKAANATTGIRSMQVLFAPMSSASFNGQLDLKSGVLTSYSLQGSVGDPVRGNYTLQCLDMSGAVNLSARDTTNFSAALVKPENIALTGIQFTGLGLTGITLQSFSFSLGLGRTTVFNMGAKFPTERPLTEVGASLQVQGFFDGINGSLTGLSSFDCGSPMAGNDVGLTMTPACSSLPAGKITMRNPYLDGFSVEATVGGFSTISLSMSLPIGPNPLETSDGSVVIFS